MCARHSARIALVVACLVALAVGTAAVGTAALGQTPGQPNATPTTAPLYTRVLSVGDLPGFWSVACPVAVTSAAQWATHTAPAAELSSNGFMNGLREPLRSSAPGTRGWSVVAQFRSAAGAQREARSELDRARSLGGAFSQFEVPGIAGGHGYLLPGGSKSRIAIAFTEGRFQYLLQITGVARSHTAALRKRLAEAATTLYGRTVAH
jgi:hypothetical protein